MPGDNKKLIDLLNRDIEEEGANSTRPDGPCSPLFAYNINSVIAAITTCLLGGSYLCAVYAAQWEQTTLRIDEFMEELVRAGLGNQTRDEAFTEKCLQQFRYNVPTLPIAVPSQGTSYHAHEAKEGYYYHIFLGYTLKANTWDPYSALTFSFILVLGILTTITIACGILVMMHRRTSRFRTLPLSLLRLVSFGGIVFSPLMATSDHMLWIRTLAKILPWLNQCRKSDPSDYELYPTPSEPFMLPASLHPLVVGMILMLMMMAPDIIALRKPFFSDIYNMFHMLQQPWKQIKSNLTMQNTPLSLPETDVDLENPHDTQNTPCSWALNFALAEPLNSDEDNVHMENL